MGANHAHTLERAEDTGVKSPATSTGLASPDPLAPLGRLAAELAHDLNNQLSAILNYSFVIERELRGGRLVEYVKDMREAAWRASAFARRLKVIGRPRHGEDHALELDQLLYDLRPLLAHMARERSLRIDIPVTLPRIAAAESAVEQLIVALLLTVVARTTHEAALSLSLSSPTPESGEPVVRITCRSATPMGSVQATEVWAVPGSRLDRAALHGVVRRCNARLGHDQHGVWADLPQLG